MKKPMRLFAALAAALTVQAADVCHASVAQEDMALGDIYLHRPGRLLMMFSDVKKIYGNPTSGNPNQGFGDLKYGDSVELILEEGHIVRITVNKNNGWKTPDGLAVGMSREETVDLYGEPDRVEKNGGKTLYVYFDDDSSPRQAMGVLLGQDSVVTAISLTTNTMAEFSEAFPSWVKMMLA